MHDLDLCAMSEEVTIHWKPIVVRPARREAAGALTGIVFAALCVMTGVLIGGLIALDHTPAAKASIAPPPRPAPKVEPIVVEVPKKPVVATVRVASEPDGADVVLVDGGVNVPLGATPLDAQLDPAKRYDLVFTREGFETRTEHVDPKQLSRVDVALEPVVVVAEAPAPVVHRVHARRKIVKHVEAAPEPEVVESGLLRISTKPPCKIAIDGKSIDAPQGAIALRVGTHRVTLTNAEHGIDVTTQVEITADHAASLVQDFTK